MRFFSTVIALLFSASASSQVIIPVRSGNGKTYEYVDSLTRKKVSEYAYDQAEPFYGGRARVNRNGLWGFINSQGIEVIPCKYIHANDFSEGLASVSIGVQEITENTIWIKDEKYGVIDTMGNKVIPFEFDEIKNFKNGMVRAKDMVGKKWGWINRQGLWLIQPKFYQINDFNVFGMAKAELDYDSVGYINALGDFVIKPVYYHLGDFEDGIALAKKWGEKEKYDGKYGFIDTKGEIVIPFNYDRLEGFSENLALAGKKDKSGIFTYGYLDKSGTETIKFQYNYAYSYFDGAALVRKRGDYFLIDRWGKALTNDSYDLAENFGALDTVFNNALHWKFQMRFGNVNSTWPFALVSKNGYWGAINRIGKEVVPLIYDSVGKTTSGFVCVKGNVISFIDLNGNKIKTSFHEVPKGDYFQNNLDISADKISANLIFNNNDRLIDFESESFYMNYNYSIVKSLETKKYAIVSNGKNITNFDYDSLKLVSSYSQNDIIGFRNGSIDIIMGYFNTPLIIPVKYSAVENVLNYDCNASLNIISNKFRVKKNMSWGVISLAGNSRTVEVINPVFDDIGFLPDFNSYLIPVKKKGKWGFIDTRTSAFITENKYESAGFYSTPGVWQVKKGGKWGFINEKEQPLTDFIFDDVVNFNSGDNLCGVKRNGKWGFINKNFEWVMNPIFNSIGLIRSDGSYNVGRVNRMFVLLGDRGEWRY